MDDKNKIYYANRQFFLKKENIFFLSFLFLSACTFKLNHIDSLGMGYEAALYFVTAWILLSRFPITRISYFRYGYVVPFVVSLLLISLRILFAH